jgi:hypothetical protein
MKYKSLFSLTLSLAIAVSGGFVPIPANAEPDPVFKPIIGEIRNKLPSNLVFRLPSRLPKAITNKISPQLIFNVNSERAYLALEDKNCLPRFRRGSRGFVLACQPFSVASSTLASKYYREDTQRGDAVQLSRNLPGYHFQGDGWNTVSWVQDNTYFTIYSGYVRRNELIEVARSMLASSQILAPTKTSQQVAPGRSLPANSQEITEAQIRGLNQQISTAVQNAERRARAANIPESQKIALREYRQFWQNKNPEIARFVGQWGGNWGGSFTVFPTNKPERVCVQYGDELGVFVEPGIIKVGKIYWKSPFPEANSVLLRQSNSLVVIRIHQGKPVIWPQPISVLPRPELKLTNSRYTYESLGCITDTNVTARSTL